MLCICGRVVVGRSRWSEGMFQLPLEIQGHIYEFCSDKYDGMGRVFNQFLKGGFYRKNLRIRSYMENQQRWSRRFWRSSRPELWCCNDKVYTLVCEWSFKKQSAFYSYTRKKHYGQTYHCWSGSHPVSTWLQNIQLFETTHPELTHY